MVIEQAVEILPNWFGMISIAAIGLSTSYDYVLVILDRYLFDKIFLKSVIWKS